MPVSWLDLMPVYWLLGLTLYRLTGFELVVPIHHLSPAEPSVAGFIMHMSFVSSTQLSYWCVPSTQQHPPPVHPRNISKQNRSFDFRLLGTWRWIVAKTQGHSSIVSIHLFLITINRYIN